MSEYKPGTYLVTGGGRGLGLEIARSLLSHPGIDVVLAVRRPEAAESAARALGMPTRVRVEALDVGSLASVRAFCARWREPLAGLVNNAGVQCNGPTRLTADGLEETFAINYLGALTLTLGLEPWLAGGRVLFIGSGTHDPRHPMARLSGFRGARFVSIRDSAQGGSESVSDRQLGLDRYATSKLLCTSVALALARRRGTHDITYFTFDPGMLPGTALAREAPGAAQFAWNHVLPALHCLLPDTTTPERAAERAAWLVASPDVNYDNGATLNHRALPSRYVSAAGRDPQFAAGVLEQSLTLLGALPPT